MNIYQHYRQEERDFIDRVLHWKSYVEDHYTAKLTDFLDPREQHIAKSIIGEHSHIQVEFFGGKKDCERKRAIFFPCYYEVQEKDFLIHLFEIDYPRKFITIVHPQVLGSLMSLGLRRGKFGDILIQDDRVQFFTAEEVSDYVQNELTSIGHASITLKSLDLKEAMDVYEDMQEITATVSSLRLDAVLSAVHSISRQKSQSLIKQGFVKVNWATVENVAFECGAGDMLSVRRFGRVKLLSIEGKTKKDKWKVIVGKQKV